MLYSLVRTGQAIWGRLFEIIEQFEIRDAVQGVILEYDTYWLSHLKRFIWAGPGLPWIDPDDIRRWWRAWNRVFENVIHDTARYQPPFWDEYCRANGFRENASPLIVRFILREPKALAQFNDNMIASLPEFQVRAEVRPLCVGYASAKASLTKKKGASVGVQLPNPTKGTLGGIMKDRSQLSKEYLISCAHVLTGATGTDVYVPAPGSKRAPAVVATVQYGVMPPPVTSGIRCNNQASSPSPVDATAAELNAAAAIPKSRIPTVDSVRSIKDMCQGDQVWFVGARSGHTNAEIGGLCIWYEIELTPGTPHCFGNIFEVKPPKPWYLNTQLARPRDSGSWILSHNDLSVEWNGMLIGGDGATVYCTFAEEIVNAFSRVGLQLIV